MTWPDKISEAKTSYESEQLAGFRRSQALAYQCAVAVELKLQVGMSERDAAALLHDALAARGVREYVHRPLAWFGARTAFAQFRQPLQLSAAKRLEPGMPVLLTVAPVVEGYASDSAYACRLGENALHAQMLADLEPYRQLILDGVRAHKQLTVIYRDVDRLIERQGYSHAPHRYRLAAPAPRVLFLPRVARTKLRALPALKQWFERATQAVRSDDERPAEPGLWAVAPQLAFRGVGVKWQELLVVTEHDAYWLDDDLPHVRRFGAHYNAQRFEVLA
ncbi:MAG: hypothetical protein RL701_5547 [Pseudomonadota bacterium]